MSGDHNQYQKARSIEDALQALTDFHQEIEKPRDDIIRMAREAGIHVYPEFGAAFERFAALVAAVERNKLAAWMIQYGYATGHGDTMEKLCDALVTEIVDSIEAEVAAEREACAKVCEGPGWNAANWCAKAIRARSNT